MSKEISDYFDSQMKMHFRFSQSKKSLSKIYLLLMYRLFNVLRSDI